MNSPPAIGPEHLKARVASSVLWTVARFSGDQLANLVVFICLARVLGPAEFGTFLVAVVVAEAGKIIVTSGLVSSLYQVPEITPQIADTVFWGNVGVGCAFSALAFGLSGPAAWALGAPGAEPLIIATGLIVPITALGAAHMSRNLRNFGHKALAIRSLLSGVIGGGLAVTAAANGFGAWSLVIQRLATETINTAVAWVAFRWIPGRDFSWSLLRSQAVLGSSVASAQLMLLALGRCQDVIISRTMGLGAVGVYRTGWKVIELIAQGLITPFSAIATPTLARFLDDRVGFERSYLKLLGISSVLSFPAIIGMGVLADHLIPLIFGPQWSQSVRIAEILSLLFLPFTLNFFAEPALVVRKRPDVILKLSVAQLGGTIFVGILAAPYGLAAFAAAYVLRSYLTLGLQLWLSQKALGIRAMTIVRVVAPQLAAAILMGIAVLACKAWLPVQTDASWITTAVAAGFLVAVGAVVYFVAFLVLLGAKGRRQYLQDFRSIRKPTS